MQQRDEEDEDEDDEGRGPVVGSASELERLSCSILKFKVQ